MAVVTVEGFDAGDLGLGEFEWLGDEVLADASGICALGDGDVSLGEVPGQDDLGGGGAFDCCEVDKCGVLKVVPISQGSIGDSTHASA